MTLGFLFARFYDQTANGGCDQDSKRGSSTGGYKKHRVQPTNTKCMPEIYWADSKAEQGSNLSPLIEYRSIKCPEQH